MKQISATIDMDVVLDGVMSDLREDTTKNYAFYLKWAIDCRQELGLFMMPCVKTIRRQVGDNFTIPYEDDYIDYLAVGVPLAGQLWTLSLNQNLIPPGLDECKEPIEEVMANPNLGQVYPYFYYFASTIRNGQYVGEQYATGGGWNSRGYFKPDDENKVFRFQSVVPKTEVIIQYNSTGINCDGTVQIPYESYAAHKAFVHWQRALFDELLKYKSPGAYLSIHRDKERLWKIEYKKLQKIRMAFTIAEYMDMRWKAARQAPKR